MPGALGTMVTKTPKIPTLVGLESKGAAGKKNKQISKRINREKVKHKSVVLVQ